LCGGDLRRFAAGRGAHVEKAFVFLQSDRVSDDLRAFVLKVNLAALGKFS
jgi:hypothetical protein